MAKRLGLIVGYQLLFIVRQKEVDMHGQKILNGRPKLTVDFAIVLRMRDVDNLGWSRMAQQYTALTGQYVSRDTMKRRYFDAIVKQKLGRK